MKKIKMYKYKSNYGNIVTHINLEMGNPIILFRLVADQGKILTNDIDRVNVTEVYEKDLPFWKEVDKTEEELALEENLGGNEEIEEETNYKELLDIVTGAEDAE